MSVQNQKRGRVAALALLVLLLLIGAACGRSASGEGGEDYTVNITASPTTVGPATVSVSLRDADGTPLTGATVKIEGNMSHAGMKPVFSDAHEVGNGDYATDDFEFTMGGDWIITASITLADGTTFDRSVDVPAVTE